jgi:hypothetical protein
MKNRYLPVVGAAALLCSSAIPSFALTVFSDNFNSDNPSLNATTADFLGLWTPTPGSVDIIGGAFGFDYYPGNGYYVDLNGSNGQYGGLVTTQVFGPGTYTVSFNLGSSVGGAGGVDNGPTPKTTEVYLGNSAPVFITLPNLPPNFTSQSFTFTTTVAGTLDFLSLVDVPPNSPYATYVGNILDNVRVSTRGEVVVGPAPLPGALALFAGGLGLLGFTGLARRRTTKVHPLTTV